MPRARPKGAAARPAIGNPPKYNAKRHKVIIEAILKGNSRTVAFTLSGCNPDTVFGWLKNARDRPEEYPQYVELLQDVEYAEALFESEKVDQVIQAAASGTWQAAAWWLERRRPKDWGRDREISPQEAVPRQQVNVLILEDSNAREASRELLRGLSGLGSGSTNEPVRARAVLEPAEDATEG